MDITKHRTNIETMLTILIGELNEAQLTEDEVLAVSVMLPHIVIGSLGLDEDSAIERALSFIEVVKP